ncbi:putative triacylglycerol lipase [Rosa chinensis]|uniref:Putative triacylglycerol lipase n=1 Tax=Rosa chinensis TaxID=74649 RepID=A0A2P6R5C3_ROSCH|nr:GDSL esterase/lipase At5g18430 [Rosa chinensis]PRQ41636.1 putative triacylglycerol lipase [Rosa chinensis]
MIQLMATYSLSNSVTTICCLIFLPFLGTIYLAPQAEAARAFFVFGDSLVDNGNNNYLITSARADSYPYGIDSPTHRPSGRFSNGLNIADIISQKIGSVEPPLPYLSPDLNGRRLLIGANFASAGVGILNDTGIQFLNILRMPIQLAYFQEYQRRVQALIGRDQAKRLIEQSLVLITVGGNDFVNNYYLGPSSARSRQLPLPRYVKYVISEYEKLLMNLYKLGPRRILVTGTGAMGCVPGELATRATNGGCSAEVQRAGALYNPQLDQMLKGLNKKLGKDVFISANNGQMHLDFINNPRAFGFTNSKVACCGQGPYNGVGLCTFLSNLCPNRALYAFWDAFHPSEKANRIIVQKMNSGSIRYMSPMNLSTIMALDSTT